MFAAASNPYDELITKATDENLASEDWALNMEVCDKVSGEGQNGSRNAVGALQKRLAHRNPSVQLYALELANTLVQNCGKSLLEELSSRNWTGALDRLINDRATPAPVKKKALGYVKTWAKQFEDTGDPNLGVMGELYDQLRAKNMQFDEPEPVPEVDVSSRQREEEEELRRVLELSKQDKGGRNTYESPRPSAVGAVGASSSRPVEPSQSHVPPPDPEPAVSDINSATRVRALYTFTTAEVGELNFERGDVIKVLDRGFKEWWRGACNGKIGIFPVTYVEAMTEPTPKELQEEAQEEARVFASLGLVDQLLQTLKSLDPSQGDRLEDRPEIEEMYQASVGLQGQINALIKKYSDQKAELEHMNANFLRAMKQYETLRNAPSTQVAQYGYTPPPQDPYAAAGQYPNYPQQPPSYDVGYPAQAPPTQYPQQTVPQISPNPDPHSYAGQVEAQRYSQQAEQHHQPPPPVEQQYPQQSEQPYQHQPEPPYPQHQLPPEQQYQPQAQVSQPHPPLEQHYQQQPYAQQPPPEQPRYAQHLPEQHGYTPQQPEQHQYAQHLSQSQQSRGHVQPPSQSAYPQQSPSLTNGPPRGDFAPPMSVSPSVEAHPAQSPFYQQNTESRSSLNRAPSGAPDLPPQSPRRYKTQTQSGAAGIGAGAESDKEHAAAWDAYYSNHSIRLQPGTRYPSGPPPSTNSAPPSQPSQPAFGGPQYGAHQAVLPSSSSSWGGAPAPNVDGMVGGMNRMSVHGN